MLCNICEAIKCLSQSKRDGTMGPWGIRQLISTHSVGGEGGLDWLFLATQNSKSQVLPRFSFAVGVGEGERGSFAKNRLFLAK